MGHLSLTLFLLFMAFLARPAGAAPDWNGEWRTVRELAVLLRKVPEGRRVLEQAERKDPKVLERVLRGNASFTESTFSRTYSLIDGKEVIQLKHVITLSRRLKLADAVVDLAHELLHFTEKGMLDPYRPGFELEQFVRKGIEGEGGELAALEVECKVAWQLERSGNGFPRHRLCVRYRQKEDRFNRKMARLDYYSVGTWYQDLTPELKQVMPELSDGAVTFTSSYAAKPYPVALAEEYAMTRRMACRNNRRKYRLIAAQSDGGRGPASAELMRERMRLRAYERLYCESVKPEETEAEVED